MFQVNVFVIIYFILLELVDQELHFNIFRRTQQEFQRRGKKCRSRHLYQFSHSPAQPLGGAVASWLVRSSPDRAVWVRTLAGDIVLCSWARHLTLTMPLFTQGYKWVPVNVMLGITLGWSGIPSRGE